MLRNTLKCAGLWALLFCVQVSAQHTQSGYSAIGIGEVNWGGYSQHAGMAGLGISYNSRFFLNNVNPALMATNLEAVFQLGLAVDNRLVTGNTPAGTRQYSTLAGGFKDLGFVLPIQYSRWNMGFGLTPYSTANYGFTTTKPDGPAGASIITSVKGRGGIDEVFWNNSFRMGRLMLGAKLLYRFGSIRTRDVFRLGKVINTPFSRSSIENRKSFSGIGASLGVAYKLKLKGKYEFLNFGSFYTLQSRISSRLLSTFQNRSLSGTVVKSDTLVNNVKSSLTLPSRFGLGISYEKAQSLTLGIDFITQNWTKYVGEKGADPAYGQSFRLAIGGEIIPNYQDLKILKRISYRLGVHYERTPFAVNGQGINDMGISVGASVPLNGFWGVSHLNLGLTFGRRGDIIEEKVREDYVRFNLGFSMQDITWFSRGKFD